MIYAEKVWPVILHFKDLVHRKIGTENLIVTKSNRL